MQIKRYLHIWLQWLKISLGRESIFRGNAWVRLLGQALWLGTALVFFETLFLHVPSIGGWKRGQVWLLIAVNELAQQLYRMSVGGGIGRIPNLIWQGKLDGVLTKPISPLFNVAVSRMRPYDAPALLLPLALGWYAMRALNLHPTPAQWLWFGMLLAVGIAARFAITLSAVSLAFWLTRIYALPALLSEMFNLSGYPEGIFRGAARALFTFGVPVLVIANFPTAVLLGWPALPRLAAGALALGGWGALAAAAWRYGLRHYTAVGG